MPQKITEKVESTEVQGEGTYIVVRKLTHGEAKAFDREFAKNAAAKNVAPLEDLIIEHLIEWNWSDAEGVPLPLPREDPTVLDRLLEPELLFLLDVMTRVSGATAKN